MAQFRTEPRFRLAYYLVIHRFLQQMTRSRSFFFVIACLFGFNSSHSAFQAL